MRTVSSGIRACYWRQWPRPRIRSLFASFTRITLHYDNETHNSVLATASRIPRRGGASTHTAAHANAPAEILNDDASRVGESAGNAAALSADSRANERSNG